MHQEMTCWCQGGEAPLSGRCCVTGHVLPPVPQSEYNAGTLDQKRAWDATTRKATTALSHMTVPCEHCGARIGERCRTGCPSLL